MKKLILPIFIIFVQGCAFTDVALQVESNSSLDFTGPINETGNIEVRSPSLQDNREDKVRIGWKKNGFGAKTADITSANAVENILSDGIKSGLIQNGFTFVENSQIGITGSVDKFWIETDVNFTTIEIIGEIQCNLQFVDEITNTNIYESNYTGSYSEHFSGFTSINDVRQQVMSKAIDKLVEDIMFDEDIAEALSSYQTK